MRVSTAWVKRGGDALAAALVMGAAPRRGEPLVIDCYVVQFDGNSPDQFVRHLQIDRERGLVAIADGIGGGAIRYVGNGRLIELDGAHVVYDFASRFSGGRTTIDLRTGAFVYNDGRAVVRGTCR